MRNKFIIFFILIVICAAGLFGYWKHIESEAIAVDNGVVAFKKGNYQEAIAILEPYAHKGNQAVELTLGTAYAFGHGVEIDREKAKDYLKAATEDKAPEFYLWVAKSFENGEDQAPKDINEALAWYKIASEAGNIEANSHLNRLSSNQN